MVHNILQRAGFVEGKTYKETRFLKPPTVTFAVFDDTYDVRGADYHNLIEDHSITIEVYEYTPDPEAEQKLEQQFDKLGLEYTKQERYWIQAEQIYQIIYEFDYITKRRG